MSDLEDTDLPARWGDAIRRGRMALGLLQVDVAAIAGVSRNLVSRLELGRGGSVPLGSWAQVAHVVGVHLRAEAGHDAAWIGPIERRCHELVTEVAWRGGWSAVTEIGARWSVGGVARIETLLVRPKRREVAIVRAWHPVPVVSIALEDLARRIAAELAIRDGDWAVRALVLCPRTADNRRRITETTSLIAPRLPAHANDWSSALASDRRPIPSASGLLWVDRWATRIKPAPHRPGWEQAP